jgi:hypothetical protein
VGADIISFSFSPFSFLYDITTPQARERCLEFSGPELALVVAGAAAHPGDRAGGGWRPGHELLTKLNGYGALAAAAPRLSASELATVLTGLGSAIAFC